MKFNSAEGMYHYLCNNGDLYNPVNETYMFQYNEDGAICCYSISEDHAAELAVKSIEDGEYWGAYLGTGGYIYEAEKALEICSDFADENWINCREYAADVLKEKFKEKYHYKFGGGRHAGGAPFLRTRSPECGVYRTAEIIGRQQ